jgi:hypothetical protein
MSTKFTPQEAETVQKYLQTKLGNPALTLRARSQNADSLEVLLNGEFLGVVYKDVEDGETSYDFNMAILEIDLAA